MDPKIAAGFSILGNALMPDPARLAQAELSRSAREQNQAQTRKLGLEADALQRAAENLARLQDVLSNPATSARDIIVPGIAAGLTNDPTQIPQFALASEGLENLDFNDPASFSRALLSTGTVANQAATPQGFAADQARQVQANEADNQTAMRNADIAAQTDLAVEDKRGVTDLAVQNERGIVEKEIADAQLRLDELMKQKDRANQRLIAAQDVEARTGDVRARLAAEAEIADLNRQAEIEDQNADRLAEDARKVLDIAGAQTRTELETAGERDVAELGAETDLSVAETQARARVESARIAAGGGAGGVPKISRAQMLDMEQDIFDGLARRADPDVDFEEEGAVEELTKSLDSKEVRALIDGALRIYPNNYQEALDLALSAIKKNKKGKWKVDTSVFEAPGEEEGTSAETGTEVPPAELNGRVIVFESGEWIYEDTGQPVE